MAQSNYCLPIEDARKVFADALKSKVQDTLINQQAGEIVSLKAQNQSQYETFTELLNIEKQKGSLQREVIQHAAAVADSYKEEAQHYKQQARKYKRQRNTGAGAVALIVLLLLI